MDSTSKFQLNTYEIRIIFPLFCYLAQFACLEELSGIYCFIIFFWSSVHVSSLKGLLKSLGGCGQTV